MHRAIDALALIGIALAAAAPAMARDGGSTAPNGSPSPSVPSGIDVGGDRVTIGVGVATVPSYIGSHQRAIVPTAEIQGQIAGIALQSQGTGLSVDVIPDRGAPGWKLQAGPVAMLRLDRHGRVKDDAVAALGKRNAAWELGGWAGIQRTGVITSPYDTLSFSTSWQADIGHAHRSYTISPGIDYATPLSTKAYADVALGADYVGKGFGHYYYDVDTSGSLASGLPAYDGADRAGWKDWNISLLGARSLTGTLTHGFKLFVTGGYARMVGAYRRSPVVDIAGSPNQWSGAVGVGYTF